MPSVIRHMAYSRPASPPSRTTVSSPCCNTENSAAPFGYGARAVGSIRSDTCVATVRAWNAGSPATARGKIATPPTRSAAGSTAFSRATPSSPPRSCVCAGAMRVTIVTSGAIIAASGAISPGALMPASITARRCLAGSSRVRVNETPRWLFKLPSVASTPPASPPSRSARRSLVDVLPALPVIAATGPRKARRCSRAIVCSAWSGSATTSCGKVAPARGAATSAALAPAACASPRKSCPSRCAVFSATKTSPRLSRRVSTPKPVKGATGTADQRPPVQCASCSKVNVGIVIQLAAPTATGASSSRTTCRSSKGNIVSETS